ncbi:MAG: hypothetical protein IT384_06760 [Deltaproteobacteria bacterium]|nr:hypothetical protein [Deltaproteobacteria bacterium]
MAEGGLNIGVFHELGDFSGARNTSVNHCRYLEKYTSGHRFLYHHGADPVTRALRSIRFDAIIFDASFLCWRWVRPRSFFEQLVDRYRFLGDQPAVRAAFPQDEYDHGEILDEWLADLRVDLVWSVVWDGWDLFFPRTRRGATIHRGLTGYVDDADIARMGAFALPWTERTIDVSYRARDLPPQFGRHGRLKSELGTRFARAAEGRDLRLDLSNREADVLLGDEWLRFLGHSKYVLGCEGGSSLWDPRGEIRARIDEYLAEHTWASYAEVEAACFPGQNREPPFSAIGPRLFEVSAARAGHILLRAPYLGQLQPQVHYLALNPDLSNAAEVLDALEDSVAAKRRIEACYEALIAPDTYRYSTHAVQVMAELERVHREKGVKSMAPSKFLALKAQHEADLLRLRGQAPIARPPPSLLQRLQHRVRRSLPDPVKSALRPGWRRVRSWWRSR